MGGVVVALLRVVSVLGFFFTERFRFFSGLASEDRTSAGFGRVGGFGGSIGGVVAAASYSGRYPRPHRLPSS